MDTHAELERARAAYRSSDWSSAYAAFTRADGAIPLDAEDLWKLGLSAFLTGRHADFQAAVERAHLRYLEKHELAAAARSAFWLGFGFVNTGEMARASGWFARAGRLLERHPGDCVERGYLLLPHLLQQLETGDFEAAAAGATAAVEMATRFADADLLALGLTMQGRALLGLRRLEEGLTRLDEAMIGVETGELSPQVTGLVYCTMIGACRRVYALERAHEWTAALTAWCERQPDIVPFSGQCRVYRAEILQLHGEWQEAVEEAQRAEDMSAAAADPRATAAALYQQADVHRLRGDFEAAEAAYLEVGRAGVEPQPGLALLRLAQGRADVAAAAIGRAVAAVRDPLGRVRLLPAQVEILLALGDIKGALAACAELQQAVRGYEGGVLDVVVDQVQGAIELARGDAVAALAPLRSARDGWDRLPAPYAAARVNMLLGRACSMLGDHDTAALAFNAARDTFTRLGARPDLDSLDSAIGGTANGHEPHDAHGLTPRELDVLARLATGRTNRAIATELFISERTVARHVSNIFDKLNLSSRSAATAYAWEHGLVESRT